MKYITTENIWAINIITLFTIFFPFVNEKKKSCTKTQEEIKFKETRFHFLLRMVFSLPVTSVFGLCVK